MAAEKTVQRSTVRTPEEVVRSYFDAVIARDPDAMAEHWADDGIEEILPVGIFRGPEEVKGWFTELFTAVPDFDMTLDRVLAHENNVLVQWRAGGDFTGGPLMGIDPTGKRVELRGLDWLEVEGDKVVRNTAFADGAALARGHGPASAAGLRRREGHVQRLQHVHEGARRRVRRAVPLMVILVAFTTGMVWWVSAWALGVKSFDAFMVTALIVVLAAGVVRRAAAPAELPRPRRAARLAEERLRHLEVLQRDGLQ